MYPPLATVQQQTMQSIPNITWTAITWDTLVASRNMTWSSSAPTRLTANTAARYIFTFNVELASNATGARAGRILYNSTTAYAGVGYQASGTTASSINGSTELWMNVGDYVELDVYQNSGGALSLSTTFGAWPQLAARFISF